MPNRRATARWPFGLVDDPATGQLKLLRRFAVICVLFLVCVLAWFALDMRREYRTTRAEAEASQERLAVALAAHAGRVLGDVTENLAIVGNAFANYLDVDGSERAARLISVREVLERDPAIENLYIIDADGHIQFEDRAHPALEQALLEGRFKTDLAKTPNGQFELSDVVVDRNGQQHIFFIGRIVLRADRSIAGRAVASVNLGVFQRAYDALRPGEQGGIALFRQDGALLVRSPFRAELLNRTLTGPLFTTYLPKAPAGSFMEMVQTDHAVRIVGYSRVAGLPLVVATGVPEAVTFAPWRRALLERIVAFSVAMAVLSALTWIGYRLFRQQEHLWQQRREADKRFRDLAESVPAIVYATGPDGVTAFVNRAWTDLTGQPPDSALADGWFAFMHPDDVEDAKRRWAESVRTGCAHATKVRLRSKDGAYRWHLSQAAPIRGENGDIVCWYGTATDIDGIRQAELRAQESEAEFRMLFDDLPVGISDTTADGRIIAANTAWRRMYGVDESGDLAGVDTTYLYADPASRSRWLERLVRHGGTGETVIERRRKDGTVFWAEIHARAVLDADGRLQKLRSMHIDVTARRSLEDQLRQAQKMEAVGQLTGGIAHDFNNLLTVILGNGQLLADKLADNPKLKRSAEMMVVAAQRGADLTRSLLAFARKQVLEPKVTDINDLVSRIRDLLHRTLGENVEIDLVQGAGVWPAAVDSAQLEAAIINLALNARDAMPAGGKLTIETANAMLDDEYARGNEGAIPGPYVMVAVTDSGAGMTPEVQAKAFDPFFTTKEVGKGTGLGLSMVYGFIRQSNGHIKLYSEVGHGTTVKLYLPRAAGAGASVAPARVSAEDRVGDEVILLVEDDDMVRAYGETTLRNLGYSVLQAGNGPAALEILRDGKMKVDLLFTDVVMPGGMSGPQLAAEALRLRPALKVLFTSGYAESAIGLQGKLDPGAELLSKPYRRQELAAKLRTMLDR